MPGFSSDMSKYMYVLRFAFFAGFPEVLGVDVHFFDL